MIQDLTWTPFWALFKREVHRFIKVIFQTLFAPLISSLLYLLIFGVSIGDQIPSVHGTPYLAFLIPGLVMMSTLRNAFDNASGSITVSKFLGELEDLKIAPISPIQICWGSALGALMRGLLVGLLTLGVGIVFYWIFFEEPLPIAHPILLFLFLIAGGLSFAHLGLSISMLSTSFEQVTAINTFVLLPLIYLGGVFFSLEHLHPFWQKFSSLNPLLYLVNGVRYSILGTADVPIQTCILITAATLLLFHLLALWSLKNGSYQRW